MMRQIAKEKLMRFIGAMDEEERTATREVSDLNSGDGRKTKKGVRVYSWARVLTDIERNAGYGCRVLDRWTKAEEMRQQLGRRKR